MLNRIGLTDRANDLPKHYSGGMKRRLNFGCGLVHEPRTLPHMAILIAATFLVGWVASKRFRFV